MKVSSLLIGLCVLCSPYSYAQNNVETVSMIDSVEVGATIYLQVKASKLRQSPQQWAAGIKDIKFGDKLTVLDKKSAWLKVKTLADDNELVTEGFLHSSAVTGRKIVLSASADVLLDTKVDEQDVYLAGKGFNDEVVSTYSKGETQVNFAAVEAMRSQAKPESEALFSFIEGGKLKSS